MEILTDAAFTSVEITDRLIFRDKTFIDSDRNLNANTIHCEFLSCRNIHIVDAVVNDPETFLNLGGARDIQEISPVISTNEALGENTACLGGTYNEALGTNAVTVGGEENQASGESSVAMGRAAFAKHDHSLVWNTGSEPVESTAAKQCVFASDGGMFFKLPRTKDVPAHLIPEGFACWCWDEDKQSLAMKTKQKNIMYKTALETLENELTASLRANESGVRLQIHNPDND